MAHSILSSITLVRNFLFLANVSVAIQHCTDEGSCIATETFARNKKFLTRVIELSVLRF